MKTLFLVILVVVALIMIPAGVYATPTVDGNAGIDQAPAKATQRPIKDFVDAQGEVCPADTPRVTQSRR